MPLLAEFSTQLAELLPTVGHRTFPNKLINLLKLLIPINDATILVYSRTGLPVVEHCESPNDTNRSTLETFVKGAFLLDPYYLAATRDQKFGVFRLKNLAPSGFKNSEYYKIWYHNCGYQDECGYLICIGDSGFVNISLGKSEGHSAFTKQQLNVLEAIRPTIDMVCQQHWADSGTSPSGVNLRAQLHSALNAFGSSLLTHRQTQVINLVLHGHSTKTVAEKLSISLGTAKAHRKHAYEKLEIRSQTELFYLFLDSLISANDYQGGDTLIAYLKPQKQ